MKGSVFLKKSLCSLWGLICGWRGIVLIMYSAFILITDAFVSHELLYVLRWAFLLVIACVVLCPFLLKKTEKLTLKPPVEKKASLSQRQLALLFFGVPFVIFFALYIIHYPGGYSVDSFQQYSQALDNSYGDWHPVFHTLLAFKLPLLLTGGWTGAPVLFQILAFSAVLSYGFCGLHKYAGMKWTVIAMAFILLNPWVWVLAMYPWKDTAFAMGAMLLMTYIAHIYFSKGEWMASPVRIIVFVAVLVCTTLFRHNAILFTAPLLLAAMFCISKKRSVVICLSFLALLVAIKGPLYSALNVPAAESRQSEMLGLPINVIGAVAVNDPDALDEETREFVYAVAPQEDWEEYYTLGSFNDLKWGENTNNQVIDDYGIVKVASMAVRCFLNSPVTSLSAVIKLTGPVYTVSDDYLSWFPIQVTENDLGVTASGIPVLQSLVKYARAGLGLAFPHLFEYIGVLHLLLLLGILAKCNFKGPDGWRKLLFAAPLVAYDYGSALLLTDFSDVSRFCSYTRLIFPILLVILFRNQEEGVSGKEPVKKI